MSSFPGKDYTIELWKHPLVLMSVEAILVASLLLVLFRLRARFGLSLLFVALGVFQYMQVVLAASIYVELAPGFLISPGSAVLFTASLFAILLVYIREDALEARKLIYGLVLANFTLGLLSLLFSLHLDDPATLNVYDLPRSFFFQSPRILFSGSLALVVDVLLIIVLYEAIRRLVGSSLWLRIYTSMALVLIIDSVIFVTGAFWGEEHYASTLFANMLGKLLMAILFSSILTMYLRRLEGNLLALPKTTPEIRDVFYLLTYREKYEALREKATRDPLTGLYNRGFFNDILSRELALATRLGRATSLLMLDVDDFKRINDQLGHQAGDRVLERTARVLRDTARSADLPCRYGGDEMAVILANTDQQQAAVIAERIREQLAAALEDVAGGVTATLGVATFPSEAASAYELLELADQRLLEGKRDGRDRVVAA